MIPQPMILALLAVFVVTIAIPSELIAAGPADVERILDGCQRSAVPHGVELKCDGLLGSVSEFQKIGRQQVLENHLAGIRASAKGEVTTSDLELKVVGKVFQGVRLSVRNVGEKESFFEGRVIAIEAPNGSARVVFCGALSERADLAARCDQIIPVLAELGPEALNVPMTGTRRTTTRSPRRCRRRRPTVSIAWNGPR